MFQEKAWKRRIINKISSNFIVDIFLKISYFILVQRHGFYRWYRPGRVALCCHFLLYHPGGWDVGCQEEEQCGRCQWGGRFFLKVIMKIMKLFGQLWFIDTLTDSIFGVGNGTATKKCNVEGVRKEVGFFLKVIMKQF